MKLDDLLAGFGKGPNAVEPAKDPPPERPQYLMRDLPDALVLLALTTTCSCGASYKHPNPGLMFREGDKLVRPKRWADVYNALPREVKEVEVRVQACEACFPRKQFLEKEFVR